jgi:protein-S-isoprenylcysteine O-methyltransferase Ste14
MTSIKEIIVYIGKVWFRYRSYTPVPLLLIAIFYPQYVPAMFRVYGLLGLSLVIIGEGIRIWSVGYAGGITRTRSGDLDKLVTTGPFAYVRNPIYIGNIIMYTGATLLLGCQFLVPIALVFFFVQYTFIVFYEENILEASFANEYIRYKEHISRWIPSFYIKLIPSEHRFRLREAVHSERRTLTAIVVLIGIALVKHIVWNLILANR